MKILIIEDEKNIRENVLEILEIKGHDVMVAIDGHEGIEMLDKFKPDFVLCDIMMPVMDGYAFLEQVRSKKEYSTLPIVFLTAKAERDDYEKAISLGATDFLTKPFSFEELFHVIDKYSK